MTDAVDELREHIATNVRIKMGPDPSGTLASMSLDQLLIAYFNWRARFVPTRPRTTHLSTELSSNPRYLDHRVALDVIVAKVKSGADLTPHLSKSVVNAFQPTMQQPTMEQPIRHNRRKDLDLLLSEWGIHHLHLATTLGADGFVARTDDLLFAHFQGDDAFLLDILEHGEWTNTALVETAVRNWPNAGILHELRGGLSLATPIPDESRPQLRNAGVTTLVEVDGKVYVPAGQTLGGTAIRGTTWSTQVMWSLRTLRDQIGSSPGWEATVDGRRYGVRNINSGETIVAFQDLE